MKCSDIQMVIASQLAYVDFNKAVIDSGEYTVQEALEMQMESASGGQKNTIEYIMKLMETDQGQECANWVIRDVRNDQKNSGMYACMLDTGDRGAMIAFRGSEDMGNYDNLKKDWIQSDLGLLNSTLTPQQKAAEEYMRDLYDVYQFRYDSYNLTGHSLGGNLAMHATITAPDHMREKIDRCLNLDGPGVSQQYLIAHANDIRKSQGLIDHYQWSIIGTLLNTIPGSQYRTIKANTPNDKGLLSIFWRHDTRNVTEYDENGNMTSGEQDWLAEHGKEISSYLDTLVFSFSGSLVWAMLYNYADMRIDQIRNIKEAWQSFFWSSRTAEFSVRASQVADSLEQLSRETDVMISVQEEISRVRAELALRSMAEGYIKYKLWNIENRVGALEQKIQTYLRKGKECVQLYQLKDTLIAEKV